MGGFFNEWKHVLLGVGYGRDAPRIACTAGHTIPPHPHWELLHRFRHQLHRLLHLIQACPSTTQRLARWQEAATTIRQAMHMPAQRPLPSSSSPKLAYANIPLG